MTSVSNTSLIALLVFCLTPSMSAVFDLFVFARQFCARLSLTRICRFTFISPLTCPGCCLAFCLVLLVSGTPSASRLFHCAESCAQYYSSAELWGQRACARLVLLVSPKLALRGPSLVCPRPSSTLMSRGSRVTRVEVARERIAAALAATAIHQHDQILALR